MGWSDKYKKSIDCSNPKGFSQRAHCQGKKKKVNEEKKGPCPKTGEAVCKCKDKREAMNFTDYINSAVPPLYEAEGDIPKCPPGYRYDKTMKMCVPKSNRDAIGKDQKYGDKDLKPGSGPGYNVWGSSGYDGAGYAFEEPPTTNPAQDSGGTTY